MTLSSLLLAVAALVVAVVIGGAVLYVIADWVLSQIDDEA